MIDLSTGNVRLAATVNTGVGPRGPQGYTGATGMMGMPGMSGSSSSIAAGLPGQVMTISAQGTAGWINSTVANTSSHTLEVQGDAKFSGEIVMKGVKLSETLAKIEERLGILHPNPELEDKWDELKELSKRYKELESEIIEKEKVWAILKR